MQFVLAGLFAKLSGKKVAHVTIGSGPQVAQWSFGKSLLGLGKIIFPPVFKVLLNINYSVADLITVQSPSIIDFWGLGKYKCKIVTGINGTYIDTDLLKMKKDIDSRRDLVGYIGRVSPEKGIMNFVDAMPLILRERSDVEFLIGGDGPLLGQVKDKLEVNKFNSKVSITGWIPHDEVPTWLSKLKLLVLPSYSEGLTTTVLEAMACGTPVLATPVGGLPDIIKDGETGFIMEDNSPECIAGKVVRALAYPKLDELVHNARRLIEEQYVYEAMVERYRYVLERLMGDEVRKA
jgi:glycosyltransferase involved in cell wall biosynthesis